MLQPGPRWTTTPRIVVPGSKSLTNRALLIASLARGRSIVRGILRSDDSYWCAEALRTLGVPMAIDGTTATIDGIDGQWPTTRAAIYVGAAGTAARFLPPALCITDEGEWEIDAADQMRRRPMAPLFAALTALGARVSFLGDVDRLPVRLLTHGLSGGTISIPASQSSQFVSGVLIASPYARTPVTIRVPDDIVQSSYVKMTLSLMRRFGVEADASASLRELSVPPGGYVAQHLVLEPDVSTAGYFLALAAVTGQALQVKHLTEDTEQPDIGLLAILRQMGCRITATADGIEIQGPPKLTGGFTVDMHQMSDQALTVAALAVFADAPTTVTGVAHIRAHESNRIRAIADNLSRLGIRVDEHDDGFTVHPGPTQPASLDPYDDHRVAMSLSVVGAAAAGIRISHPGCVSKTFPEFYSSLEALGVGVRFS